MMESLRSVLYALCALPYALVFRIPTSLRGVGPYGPYGPEAEF